MYPDLSHVPRALIFFLQHTPVLGDLFAAFGRGDGEDESTSGKLFKMLEAYGVSMGCVRVHSWGLVPRVFPYT